MLKSINCFANSKNLLTFATSKDKNNIINNLKKTKVMDIFGTNALFETLRNIVVDDSIYLTGNGNEPVLEPEDSCLYLDGDDELVWQRFLGTDYTECFKVCELDDDELEILIDLLLDNDIIAQKTSDYIIVR